MNDLFKKDYLETALLLRGASEALRPTSAEFPKLLAIASHQLEVAADNICAQGYFGCRSGDHCTSDHK